jgi:hypothetical protein
MNIFVLNKCHQHNVQAYVDSHVSKMVLETAQLLSTCHHWYEPTNTKPIYKPSHVNHPCSVWLRQTSGNYRWLCSLWYHMHKEFQYRFRKDHKSFTSLHQVLRNKPTGIPSGPVTEHPQCMPDVYRCKDVITAYRSYYVGEKQHIAVWTKRNKPSWFKLER